MVSWRKMAWGAAACLMVCGCDPITRYKVASTIFDGVPKLPPAEQLCREYHERKTVEETDTAQKKQASDQKTTGSIHPPYAEKRCNDCHDKSTNSGFVVEKDLCSVCHKNFLKGTNSHGPAAVGSCLECHLPHSSSNPSLLKKPLAEVCGVCHVESRQAKDMHDKFAANGMACPDCHDPHSGNNRFFLK